MGSAGSVAQTRSSDLDIWVCVDATRRAAGKPATGPSAAAATGTDPMARATEAKRGVAKTGSPTGPPLPPLPEAPVTLPPPPS